MILIFIGCILALIAGLRYGDRDYLNYLDIYSSVPNLFQGFKTEDIHGEPGYLLLNSMCKTIGLGSLGVFLIMSCSSVALSLNFFRKHTPFFLVATLIYFSHVFMLRDMMQIRAGLAASISLYALPYIEKRKFLPFFLILIAGASMHAGVLILTIAYFIYPVYRKSSRLIGYLVVSGFILGIILKASLIEMLMTAVFNIPAVTVYLADPEYFTSLGLFNVVLLKNLLLLILLLYYKKEIAMSVAYFDVFLLCLVLSIFWLSAFNNFSIFAGRLATYFSNVEHILLPALFFTRINRYILWIVVVLYCLMMFASKFSIFEDLSYIFFL
ncbi:EpsG family protein [Pedobacter panaciterrae]